MEQLLRIFGYLLGGGGYVVILCTIVYSIYLLIAKELNKQKIKTILIILFISILCVCAYGLLI